MNEPRYIPTLARSSSLKKTLIQSSSPTSSNYIYPTLYPEGTIDISNQILNDEQLDDLYIYLKKNIKIGNILWSEDQNRFDIKFCKIIKRLKKNNQSFNYHPSDYLCGIIAAHVYLDISILSKKEIDFRDITIFKTNSYPQSQLEHVDEYVKKLKILEFENDHGFQYALYEHKELHHLILAFRGTSTNSIKDLALSLLEDSIGITLKKEDTYQQKRALEITQRVVELCKTKKDYYLTITGHSLGAWLSELAHYYCFYKFNFTKVKTVVFDSPGALDQFKVYDDYKEPSIPYSSMDITVYLSEPNIVNCMNNHIFDNNTTFRVYPDGIDNVDDSKLDFLLSTKYHSLIPIMNCFDYVTGKPKEYKLIKDWPFITPSQLSEFMKYFKYNDDGYLENPNNEPIKGVKYKVEPVNLFGGSLVTDSIIKVDRYILQLSLKNYFFSFSDYFISTQLKELKSLYQIQNNDQINSKYEIKITDQAITLDILKQRLARVIDLNPKLIKKLLKSKDDIQNHQQYKIRLNPSASSTEYYDPNNYLNSIYKIHQRDHLAIITGEEGSGKSCLALKYALDYYSNIIQPPQFESYKVLFIRADTRELIMEDFGSILLKNYNNQDDGNNDYDFNFTPNSLIDFYKSIMDSSNIFYFFIFDNVSDSSIVDPFIYYLPKSNTKAIITSQLGRGHLNLSLVKFNNIQDNIVNVKLLTNEQANQYLHVKGINSNFNFNSPISIHLLNLLLNHNDFINHNNNNNQPDNSKPIDFNDLLKCLICDFIKQKPESIQVIQVLPFLDPENISFDILSKIIDIPNYNLEENINYLSTISIINELPGKRINTYKNIQNIIMTQIINEADSIIIQNKIIQLLKSIDLSGDYPRGWRIYFNHIGFIYNNFNSIVLKHVQLIENYGISFRLLSRYQESLKYLNQALEIKKKERASTDKYSIALTLFELGKTCTKDNNYGDALTYFNQCLGDINKDQLLVSETLNYIGLCTFHLNNQNERVLEYYDKSLKLESRPDYIANIHLNIGNFYLANERINESKQEFLKSLHYAQQNQDNDQSSTPIYSKSNFKLALVEYKEKNYIEAIKKFESSIQMFNQLFKSERHKDIATSYHMIGLCYYQLNDGLDTTYLLNSLENLQRALSIRLKIHRTKTSHSDLDESYYSLGVCYNQRKEYQQSFDNFKKSYDIKKINNDNLLDVLDKLSTQLYCIGQYQTSIDYSLKQIQLLKENKNEFQLSKCYNNLAKCQQQLNQDQDSISNYQNSIKLLKTLIKSNEIKLKEKLDHQILIKYVNESIQLYELNGSNYYGLYLLSSTSASSTLLNSKYYRYKLNNCYYYLKNFSTSQYKDQLSNLNSILKQSEWFYKYAPNYLLSIIKSKYFIVTAILASSILINYYYQKSFNSTQDN